jgi:hypothetical protein
MPGTPEVTKIGPAHPVSAGDWRLCLRSSDPAHEPRYTLYFQGYTLVKWQTAVVVDRCWEDEYAAVVPDVTGYAPAGLPIVIDRAAMR